LVSLKDIAAVVGVSIRTVNRALKKEAYVSEDVRKQVLEVAQRLGYRPHLAARSLKTGKNTEVGAIVGSLDELHMAKMLAFERALRAAGYSVHLVFGPHEDGDRRASKRILRSFVERRPVAAALFPQAHVPPGEAAAQFDSLEIPYVAINSTGGIDKICIDRQQGVYDSILYLASLGKRNIAYLGYTSDRHGDYVSGRMRLDGYERAMYQMNLPQRVLAVEPHLSETEAGCRAIWAFLAGRPRPDAVQVYSDVMAASFLAALHEHNIRVPEDVAVIGFDNRRIAQLCWPRLTTVSQANAEVGAAAADVLLAKMRGEPAPPEGWSRLLPPKLVVRETA